MIRQKTDRACGGRVWRRHKSNFFAVDNPIIDSLCSGGQLDSPGRFSLQGGGAAARYANLCRENPALPWIWMLQAAILLNAFSVIYQHQGQHTRLTVNLCQPSEGLQASLNGMRADKLPGHPAAAKLAATLWALPEASFEFVGPLQLVLSITWKKPFGWPLRAAPDPLQSMCQRLTLYPCSSNFRPRWQGLFSRKPVWWQQLPRHQTCMVEFPDKPGDPAFAWSSELGEAVLTTGGAVLGRSRENRWAVFLTQDPVKSGLPKPGVSVPGAVIYRDGLAYYLENALQFLLTDECHAASAGPSSVAWSYPVQLRTLCQLQDQAGHPAQLIPVHLGIPLDPIPLPGKGFLCRAACPLELATDLSGLQLVDSPGMQAWKEDILRRLALGAAALEPHQPAVARLFQDRLGC